MFGRFRPDMLEAIRPYVTGRHVWDLGCGLEAPQATLLVQNFDCEVTAVDSDLYKVGDSRVKGIKSSFRDVPTPAEGLDVALVSWPSAHPNRHLVRLVEAASVVIYLGRNTDGTACGSWDLFSHLSEREVLECIPYIINSLTIYGSEPRSGSFYTGEEFAVLSGQLLEYEQAWMVYR